MKSSRQIPLRIAKLSAGLLLMALGVVSTAKAGLGISPIASIPYVMELSFPLSLGIWTILFSLFLLGIQLLLYRFRVSPVLLLQLPISILFGLFTDGAMAIFGQFTPGTLPAQVLFLLTGCVLLALGVRLETAASLAMLPGEATAQALTTVSGFSFGISKMLTDTAMVLCAAGISLALHGSIQGVGIGTVIAAISVGALCRLLSGASHASSPRSR